MDREVHSAGDKIIKKYINKVDKELHNLHNEMHEATKHNKRLSD